MTEAELLSQFQASRYNISVIAGQILSVTFAMIVAIYYFLHKTRLSLKAIAFGLFTAGYIALLVLFVWENVHLDGLEHELAALVKQGDESLVSKTLHNGWSIGRTALPDLLTGFVILSGWFSIAFLMFFYNFDEQGDRETSMSSEDDDSTPSH